MSRLYLLPKTVFLLLLVFFYIYPVLFSFLPFELRIRTLFAIGGVVLLFFRNYGQLQKAKFCIDRSTSGLLILSSIIAIITLFTSVINGTSDFVYLSMPFSVIVVLAAAYFITECFKLVYERISFELIAQYVVGAVVLQMVIAVIFFLQPELMFQFNKLLVFEELEQQVIEATVGLRIQGFGTNFFEAGVINSCSLILIFAALKCAKSKRQIFYYAISLTLILIIGSMMSRTTLIGFSLGVLLWVLTSDFFRFRISQRFLRIWKYFLYITGVIILCFLLLPSDFLNKFDDVTRFGFEMFFKYIDSGKFETASSNELKEVFLFPDQIKTILIGDGLLSDPGNPEYAYYMNTDVGYSRLIYYFGVVGTVMFFMFYLYLCYQTMQRNDKKYALFFMMLFLLVLVLHLKGCTNIMFFILLFYFADGKGKALAAKN